MAPVKKRKKLLSSTNHRPISANDANQQKKPLGSFVTFGIRQSLRVAMKKNHRILKKIWICNDIWMDMFPHFDRPQLGLKMALLSPRFNALVDKHFDGKSELTIWRPIKIDKMRTKTELSVRIGRKSVHFPWPEITLPNKVRFKQLLIRYIDHSVIAFLRANKQIWDKGTDLRLNVWTRNNNNIVQPLWSVFAREIWPIFAPNIRHLNFAKGRHLENLLRYTSPTILSGLDIISIDSDDLLPDLIADDGPNASAGQALSKWLQIPTKNGQPKQLICCGDTSETIEFINNFKDAFLRATTTYSAIYKIRLLFGPTQIEGFELMNERINEMLTMEKEDEDEYTDGALVLKRCQIGQVVQWKDKTTDNLNKVSFTLCGTSCIGPLSPPKADQISAKNRLKMSAGPSGQRKKK